MKYRFFLLCLLIMTLLFVFLSADAVKMECSLTSVTADPDVQEAIPAISEEDYVLGSENAVMNIIVYGDFRCGNSATAVLNLIDLQEKHPEDIRLVFRLFPRDNHIAALMCGYALEASAGQNLDFETIKILYKYYQNIFSISTESEMTSFLNKNLLPELQRYDFDTAKWQQVFYSSAVRKRVGNLRSEALQTGYISGTPTIFINDTLYTGDRTPDTLEELFWIVKVQSLNFDSCPDLVTEPGKQYSAVLDTTKGKVEIELFQNEAPLAVNSFVFLAENGWYDGSPFFRTGKEGFVLQSGNPASGGSADAGYSYPFESTQITPDQPGMVGMVKNSRGQNDSRFFITRGLNDYYRERFETLAPYIGDGLEDADQFTAEMIGTLAEEYTFFGQVTEETLPVFNSLTTDDRINTITVSSSPIQTPSNFEIEDNQNNFEIEDNQKDFEIEDNQKNFEIEDNLKSKIPFLLIAVYLFISYTSEP